MAYSSLRLFSYLVNGYVSKFKFPSYHQYVGTAVYVVFILVFVFLEFVVFKGTH